MRTEDPRVIRLADYTPADYFIDTVDLDVALAPEATVVIAELALRPNPAGVAKAPLVLDGDGIVLDAPPQLDNAVLANEAFSAAPDGFTLHQPPDRPFRLRIRTRLDPTANSQLMGLYRSRQTYCTQCEAQGFRRITYFLDRPDVLATYRVRIEADAAEAPVLLSNGNPVSSGAIEGTGRHFAVWEDPFPKPSYLFALVGGDLAAVRGRFVTASGREVELAIYVEHGKEDRAGYAMDALKRAMRWDETAFGREYDLDVFNIVAVSDFNMGAMENKGLNVFNDKYVLASPDTATDADYAGIEAVIAHEYFHNWTGDRITCRDWFQLCLKEGLTVFRDQEFSSDQRSRAVKRIADVRGLRAHQFPEDAGPFAHPVRPDNYREINNFYTATVYEKGAEVVRMLRTLIGPGDFRRGMDLYFARHDGEAATVEDFVACFAEISGRDLGQFMRWYSQAGTPELAISESFEEDGSRYILDIAQNVPPTPGQPVKEPMAIPLALGLVGTDGNEREVVLEDGVAPPGGVLEITERRHRFVLSGLDARPVPSFNRGFAAPVKITSDLTDDDLLFLARHDRDPFARWQALQTVATRLLVRGVGALAERREVGEEPRLAEALAAALTNPDLEPAYVAQLLALPSEADIAREIGADVDPDAIHRVRKSARRALARRLHGVLLDAYARLAGGGAYSPDAAGAGRRALRGAALDLLAASGKADAVAQARAHFEAADNMTDRMAGLAVLSQIDDPAREEALARFYARFADDALVLDKWFALQAMIAEPATLDRVRALTGHTAFSFANPNRIRALIGTFAAANPTQFNRADGAGHAYVADIVLDIDGRNPQVAARLLGAFRSWKTLEPARRASAEAALRRIAGTANLSRDVADLATRALA